MGKEQLARCASDRRFSESRQRRGRLRLRVMNVRTEVLVSARMTLRCPRDVCPEHFLFELIALSGPSR